MLAGRRICQLVTRHYMSVKGWPAQPKPALFETLRDILLPLFPVGTGRHADGEWPAQVRASQKHCILTHT
jgi:hypothetical protein